MNNNIFNLIMQLRGGNIDRVYNNMIKTNPQFKKFVDDNQGKTAEQIAQENGLDFNTIKNLIK